MDRVEKKSLLLSTRQWQNEFNSCTMMEEGYGDHDKMKSEGIEHVMKLLWRYTDNFSPLVTPLTYYHSLFILSFSSSLVLSFMAYILHSQVIAFQFGASGLLKFCSFPFNTIFACLRFEIP
jgi:hypothetical protein